MSAWFSLVAVGCALGTIVGVVLPYLCHWYQHTDHHCSHCKRQVTHKAFDGKEVRVFGTPEHLRQISRFPAAPKCQ